MIEKSQKTILEYLPHANILIWKSAFNSLDKAQYINSVIEINFGDWHIEVDIDEFVEFEGDSVRDMLRQRNTETIWGRFHDHTTIDGKIVDLKEDVDIFEQFPKIVDYSLQIKALDYKPILFKNQYMDDSLHSTNKHKYYDIDKEDPSVLKIHHFKWVSTTRDKLKVRKEEEISRGQHWYIQSEIALNTIF